MGGMFGLGASPALAPIAPMGSGPVTPLAQASSVTSPMSATAMAGGAAAAAGGANPFGGPTGGMPMAYGGMWPGAAGPMMGGPTGGIMAGPTGAVMAGPTGDWRLLGDLQQWYGALLCKDEVGPSHGEVGGRSEAGMMSACMYGKESQITHGSGIVAREGASTPALPLLHLLSTHVGTAVCPRRCCTGVATSWPTVSLLVWRWGATCSPSGPLPVAWSLIILPFSAICYLLLQGVLYEDTFLQVSLRATYTGSSGSLQLSLFNKATMPLHNLVLLAGVPHAALQFQLGQVPPQQLGPRAHAQVAAQALALAPFVEAPWLQLQYVTPSGMPVGGLGGGGAAHAVAMA